MILSDTGKAYLRCGSWQYWAVVLSVIPPVLGITLAVREFLVRRNRALQADSSYKGYDGEVEWNERSTIVYPAVCSLAGLIAGMFGVGGGIVKVCAYQPCIAGHCLSRVWAILVFIITGQHARSARVPVHSCLRMVI